jgi:hypothetical protein
MVELVFVWLKAAMRSDANENLRYFRNIRCRIRHARNTARDKPPAEIPKVSFVAFEKACACPKRHDNSADDDNGGL